MPCETANSCAIKNIVVVGGGDSALDWTIISSRWPKRITLVHRRDDFRAAPHSVVQIRELVAEKKIDFCLGQITNLSGIDGVLNEVKIQSDDGTQK